jgi:hypothetical protein
MSNAKAIATVLLHAAIPLAPLYTTMYIAQAISLSTLFAAGNFTALTTSVSAAFATTL